MKMLSNGRCPKLCLRSATDSPTWVGALKVIDHLMGLPWWTRLWVLQEAILQRGKVTAIYGEIVAPMSLIEASGAILPRHHENGLCCKSFWHSLPSDQQITLERFSKTTSSIEAVREILSIIKQNQIERLLFLLEKTRDRRATDPRDKIYGLLGLIEDSPDPVVDIAPDYERDVTHLYAGVAMRFIRHQQSLHVLLNHEIKPEAAGSHTLPSWVPHWGATYGSPTPNLIKYRLSQYNAWPSGAGRMPELSADSRALSVTGKYVDRITDVTRAVDKAATADLGKTLSELDVCFGVDEGHLVQYQPDGSGSGSGEGGMLPYDAVWRTLLGDQVSEHIARKAEQEFWYASDGKVFFKTARGYIGSGPPGTRAGDAVYLIFGSLVPVVLRPAASSHRLVGYAYVQGIMDGEATPEPGWQEAVESGSADDRNEAEDGRPRRIYLV
ncbi:hypothetical protein B0T24DRAFT_585965 [Lasiosphaeria ovina]|uniref:Heterokaryon incompatibility domain-containing protein n=1 Tax=Lasiosphaeria ovina TaxID=92902 RepID=A0AAE0JSB7_9PEZI|nr:hypothetical protein B0T24DRAFT_585965 [Lasiosphaeria ovina]